MVAPGGAAPVRLRSSQLGDVRKSQGTHGDPGRA
jgi:hypothetical protein